jgi:hypothetical protein
MSGMIYMFNKDTARMEYRFVEDTPVSDGFVNDDARKWFYELVSHEDVLENKPRTRAALVELANLKFGKVADE